MKRRLDQLKRNVEAVMNHGKSTDSSVSSAGKRYRRHWIAKKEPANFPAKTTTITPADTDKVTVDEHQGGSMILKNHNDSEVRRNKAASMAKDFKKMGKMGKMIVGDDDGNNHTNQSPIQVNTLSKEKIDGEDCE